MKRNLDLIRNILLAVENSHESPAFSTTMELTNYLKLNDPDLISYHVELLKDCDYIKTSSAVLGLGYIDYAIERMTSSGCDYLDNVRDNAIWGETRDKLKNYGGTLALDLVKSLASKIISQHLGLS